MAWEGPCSRSPDGFRSFSCKFPFLPAIPTYAAAWIVSPTGDDIWPTGPQHPLKSLSAAVLKVSGNPGRTIQLIAQWHELTETLRLEPADSNLTIESAPGAEPVVSGGRRLTGWVADPGRCAGFGKSRCRRSRPANGISSSCLPTANGSSGHARPMRDSCERPVPWGRPTTPSRFRSRPARN